MKTNNFIYALIILFALTGCSKEDGIDTGPIILREDIPDEVFYNFLLKTIDTNKDGLISTEEANAVKEIDCSLENRPERDIISVVGLEHFTNLEKLILEGISVEKIDLSGNKALKMLKLVSLSRLTAIDISKNNSLKELYLYNTGISSLDVSSNLELEILDCGGDRMDAFFYDNKIKSITFGNNTSLSKLNCSYTKIKSLDISKCTALKEFICTDTDLEDLDVSKNQLLEVLICSDNNLTKIDINKNPELLELNINDNNISYLNISQNTKLKKLSCSYTQISLLDIRNTLIENLSCVTPSLNSLNAKGSQNLKTLECSNSAKLIDVSESTLETINYVGRGHYYFDIFTEATLLINNCPNLTEFYFQQNFLYPHNIVEEPTSGGAITIDISGCKSLQKFSANFISDLKIDNCPSLKEFRCKGLFENIDFSNNIEIENIYILSHTLKSIDISSCTALKKLYCLGLYETIDLSKNSNIDSLTLIAKGLSSLNLDELLNLKYLNLALYSMNSDLNLSKNHILEKFIIRDTTYYHSNDSIDYNSSFNSSFNANITSLSSLKLIEYKINVINKFNIYDCQNLEYISDLGSYHTNSLKAPSELTVKNCPSLKNIYYKSKRLTSVDISECFNLDTLDVKFNNLTSIKIDNYPKFFDCSYNELTTLDISSTKIKELRCTDNLLQSLNTDGCSNLDVINCMNNRISSLTVNKLSRLKELYCSSNLLTSLDLSENQQMDKIDCIDNPYLGKLFLNNSQVFSLFKIGSNTEVVYR